MDNKQKLLKISEAVEDKLKKLPHYILMPIDDRKTMVESMVKIVMKMPHK